MRFVRRMLVTMVTTAFIAGVGSVALIGCSKESGTEGEKASVPQNEKAMMAKAYEQMKQTEAQKKGQMQGASGGTGAGKGG